MASKETWSYYGGSQFCYSRPRGSSSGVPAGVDDRHKLSLSFCWRARLLVLPECAAPWRSSYATRSPRKRSGQWKREICAISRDKVVIERSSRSKSGELTSYTTSSSINLSLHSLRDFNCNWIVDESNTDMKRRRLYWPRTDR